MHDAREQADPELCCWSADEIEGARQRSVDHGSKWRRSGGRCYVLSISQCTNCQHCIVIHARSFMKKNPETEIEWAPPRVVWSRPKGARPDSITAEQEQETYMPAARLLSTASTLCPRLPLPGGR